MKMKFGAIVVDGRGKIGGHVASKNRAGAYLRTKVTPVNPRSGSQMQVRNWLAQMSQAWRGLTQSQRNAWNAAVTDFARTDIFGDLKNPSGFNLHNRLNINLLRTGQSILTLPPAPAPVVDILLDSVTATASTGDISMIFTPAGTADSDIVIRGTAPLSAGVNFVKSELRDFNVIGSSNPSPESLGVDYTARFGAITGKAGSKIFIETVAIDRTTGLAGVPQIVSAIIQ